MRLCHNEQVDCYEAVGDNLPALLRDAAETLEKIEAYIWADLKVAPMFGHPEYADGDFILSMDVH